MNGLIGAALFCAVFVRASFVRMNRPIRMTVHMRMMMTPFLLALERNDVDVAVLDAGFGNERIGKAPNGFNGSLEKHRLKTVVSVYVGMHLRNHELSMLVLQFRKPLPPSC